MVLLAAIVGILGNISAIALYLSPTPTFWKIYKRKSTEAFSSLPYASTLMNCLLWTFYGTPWVRDRIYVVTVCGLGSAFELIYLLLFSYYAVNKKRRVRALGYLGAVCTIFALVVILDMLMLHKHSRRKSVVGSLAVASASVMYASPLSLSVLKTVIRTKSTEYMPFWLSFTSLVNGGVWTLYATLSHDVFLWIQGGMGLLLGGIQLMLYAFYCGRTTSSVAQPSEFEESAKTDLGKVVKPVDPDVETGRITSSVAQPSDSDEAARTDVEMVVKPVDPDVETGRRVPQPSDSEEGAKTDLERVVKPGEPDVETGQPVPSLDINVAAHETVTIAPDT